MKLTTKWSPYEHKHSSQRWYSGPYWLWWVFWRWFGYEYMHPEYSLRRGRFESTLEDIIAEKLASQIAEEIDAALIADLERKQNEDHRDR